MPRTVMWHSFSPHKKNFVSFDTTFSLLLTTHVLWKLFNLCLLNFYVKFLWSKVQDGGRGGRGEGGTALNFDSARRPFLKTKSCHLLTWNCSKMPIYSRLFVTLQIIYLMSCFVLGWSYLFGIAFEYYLLVKELFIVCLLKFGTGSCLILVQD